MGSQVTDEIVVREPSRCRGSSLPPGTSSGRADTASLRIHRRVFGQRASRPQPPALSGRADRTCSWQSGRNRGSCCTDPCCSMLLTRPPPAAVLCHTWNSVQATSFWLRPPRRQHPVAEVEQEAAEVLIGDPALPSRLPFWREHAASMRRGRHTNAPQARGSRRPCPVRAASSARRGHPPGNDLGLGRRHARRLLLMLCTTNVGHHETLVKALAHRIPRSRATGEKKEAVKSSARSRQV